MAWGHWKLRHFPPIDIRLSLWWGYKISARIDIVLGSQAIGIRWHLHLHDTGRQYIIRKLKSRIFGTDFLSLCD